jgi:hypothetical protein
MNRRTIIIAHAVIVVAATVLMTYFGSMEDTVAPDTQNPNPAPTAPAQ